MAEADCDVHGGAFFADGEAGGDGEGEGDGFDGEATPGVSGWRGGVGGVVGVRGEAEEAFHDEACDDAFDFTDAASRCVRGETFHQKCRSKRKQHLHISALPAILPTRKHG